MNPVLAFETSSPVLSIAVSTAKNSLLEKTVKGYSAHAENLLPVTDQLLKKKNLSIQKVETLLIGRGPGSFTGLRVGYATLKGFLATGEKKCYGALSLDLIAENAELPEGKQLCVCLDAHREKIYSRTYKRIKGKWKPVNEPSVLPLQKWLDQLADEITLTGNAAQHYESKIKESGKKIKTLPESSGYPKASTLVKFFRENPSQLQLLEKPEDFLPLYFRLSEAEEKIKAHA